MGTYEIYNFPYCFGGFDIRTSSTNLFKKWNKGYIYKWSYNERRGCKYCFKKKAAVQRIPTTYLKIIGTNNPYAAFSSLNLGVGLALIPIQTYWDLAEALTVDYMQSLNNFLLTQKSNPKYIQTVNEIKKHYSDAFARGERVFAISHSQGGLFMNDVYNLLEENDSKRKYFSGFQVASPLPKKMVSHFGYATHDRDNLINSVRATVGALQANIVAPPDLKNGIGTAPTEKERLKDFIIEYFLNHGMLTTYLYDPTIKEHVVSELIKTAQLLESNCDVLIKYHRENSDVKFIASGLDLPLNSGVTYKWDFGDNQFGKLSKNTIFHTYTTPGVYDVTLTLIFPNGERISTKTKIRIPNLMVEYSTNQLAVNFVANEPESPEQTYTWNFGDGSAAVVTETRTVSHNYTSPGDYTGSLRIVDAKGNITEAEKAISVRVASPVSIKSSFVYSAGGLQLFVNGGASRNSLDEPLTYAWDFGNGFVEVNSDPIALHTYQYAGFYDVSLLVKDPSGRTSSTMKQVFIPGNTPYITYKTYGRKVEFTIHDDFRESVANYSWNFGDGEDRIESTTAKTITHSYDDVLKKDFSVTISIGNVEAYKLSNVLPDRTLSTLYSTASNRDVRFNLVGALLYEDVSLTYVWKFGDGQFSTTNSSEVIHRYYNEGTYSAEVSDSLGVLLYNNKSFVLADQIQASLGGIGKEDSSGNPISVSEEEYLDRIAEYLSPATKVGFIYDVRIYDGKEICYSKGLDYLVLDGVRYVYMPLYNCQSRDLLPPDNTTIALLP